ncbi:MAG: sugar transferase [Candidatus Giovannonibacteria bacterium GW2011_GWA2_53_7]|uniref:Sugar transferase n=1 Tax=Candidatus Giovannonibacteria bacterium GW2011_GWA2_53_7 TaxID=1618650 RepID=A0A0G1XX27_9BACT|nr:MAG: sugar transferase [Candidatus Giovannonibacteria bacterium GW2011_GWA2_53_7]
MNLVPKREYVVLLVGDIVVFLISLWVTLAVRYLQPPSVDLVQTFLTPFSFLFAIWIFIFFLAGLYSKHTRLFRTRLFATLLYTQIINVIIAALFFFLVPAFGIAPKTILLLYLIISSVLIALWRIVLFPRLPTGSKLKGILIASGPDAEALAQEVSRDSRYTFTIETVDTKRATGAEVIREACRALESNEVAFLVVDFSDSSIAAAFPIMYDAAFQKNRFALIDVVDLYQEMFERVPLSLLQYEWILENVSSSRVYDNLKRFIDVVAALIIGVVSLPLYPFVALAVKLDDGGPLFIRQIRVGRFQQPIKVWKFRTMTGNDEGNYGTSGVSELRVTRVGKWLRMTRLDEFPQLWAVLHGDLSFVGPRPELPALAGLYSARIPYYSARYLVAPGLTGWAQTKHDRDPHHGADIEETRAKLSYDLYYLKHRSLALDISILFQTIRVVFTARGT